MKNVLIVFICLIGWFSPNVHAQTGNNRVIADHTNAWFMYFGSHKFSSKWGLHLEAQVRRADGVAESQQLLFRTGLNYHFNPAAVATVGYCFVETYPYGDFPAKSNFPENRIWEQIQLKQTLGRVEVINRFRLEQRYVKTPIAQGSGFEPGPAVYTNRFRLLSRISVPFKGKTIAPKSWYITAYEELYVNFGKNVALNIFDQNRAYLALGYSLPKVGRLELGYMNQWLVKSDGLRIENNHTLMLGLSSAVSFRN